MTREEACIYFREEELTELLKHLPQNHILRERLQKAGELIFRW